MDMDIRATISIMVDIIVVVDLEAMAASTMAVVIIRVAEVAMVVDKTEVELTMAMVGMVDRAMVTTLTATTIATTVGESHSLF